MNAVHYWSEKNFRQDRILRMGPDDFESLGSEDDQTLPGKGTESQKEMNHLNQPSIFRGHVSFQGGMMDVCNLMTSCVFLMISFMHLYEFS